MIFYLRNISNFSLWKIFSYFYCCINTCGQVYSNNFEFIFSLSHYSNTQFGFLDTVLLNIERKEIEYLFMIKHLWTILLKSPSKDRWRLSMMVT